MRNRIIPDIFSNRTSNRSSQSYKIFITQDFLDEWISGSVQDRILRQDLQIILFTFIFCEKKNVNVGNKKSMEKTTTKFKIIIFLRKYFLSLFIFKVTKLLNKMYKRENLWYIPPLRCGILDFALLWGVLGVYNLINNNWYILFLNPYKNQ